MRGARAALVIAAAGLLVAACGQAPAAQARTANAPRGTTASMVTATWGNNAGQIALHPGQELEVRLTGTGCNPTSVPVTSAPSVLKVAAVGRNSEGGAWARFQAEAPGTSVVTAENTPGCGGDLSGEGSYGFRMVVSVS